MAEVRVIESESAWERIRSATSRPVFLFGVGLIVALLIAVIVLLIVLLAGGFSSSGAIDYSKSLIVTDDYDLYVLELTNPEERWKQLLKTSKGIGAFDFYGKSTIYYSELGSGKLSSLSTRYKNLTQHREWRPTAVAVDFVTGKVYVLDARGRKLDVYDPVSGNFGIAISDLRDPVDLALDPLRGLVFIVQKSHSILKASMDGTSLVRLVVNPSVRAVSVDRQTPRLYWADADRIESSDYWGQNRLVAVCVPNVQSLGVSGNRLYWARPPDESSHRHLWTCATRDGVCPPEEQLQLPFDYPRALKVYSGEPPSGGNPCAEVNGGCHQLCLLAAGAAETTSALQRSCACYLGYSLAADGRSCEPVDGYLLYARGDLISGRVLGVENKAFAEAIVPVSLASDAVLRDKPTVDFDCNWRAGSLAYSDDKTIVVTNLTRSGSPGAYARQGCLKDLVYDWVSGDLYYVQDNCQSLETSQIGLLKPKEENFYVSTLQNFKRDNGHPRAIVLEPKTGAYFFTMWLEGEASIYRVHGLKRSRFSKPDWSINETALEYDAVDSRLYWLSANLSLLMSTSIDGSEIRRLDVSAVVQPHSLAVHGRYAYLANRTSLWRLDKLTGHGLVRIVPRPGAEDDGLVLGGVKLCAEAAQPLRPNNPCAQGKDDCQQFCLRVPKYVTSGPNTINATNEVIKKCVCEDNKSISIKDAYSCV